jgi:hypothetical protein
MGSPSNAFTGACKELDPIPQFKATGKLAAVLSRTPEPKEGNVVLIGHAYLAAEAPDGLEKIEVAIAFPAERIGSGRLMFTQLDTGMALFGPSGK